MLGQHRSCGEFGARVSMSVSPQLTAAVFSDIRWRFGTDACRHTLARPLEITVNRRRQLRVIA